MITSSRARPVLLGHSHSGSSSSTTESISGNLQLKVLAELLDCAVQTRDKTKRREYISRIMKLSSNTQKVIMGMIEQRAKPSGSTSAKKSATRSPPRRTGSPEKLQQRRSSPNRKSSPEKSLRSASAYNRSQQRRPSPTKSAKMSTSPPSSKRTPLRSSSMHQSPCGPPSQVMARMHCGSGGLTDGTLVDSSVELTAAANVAQNLFGDDPLSDHQSRPSALRQQRQTPAHPKPRSVAFESPAAPFLSPGTMESPHRLQTVIQNMQRKIDLQQQTIDTHQANEEKVRARLEKSEQEHRNAMIKVERESMTRYEDLQSSTAEQIATLKTQLEAASEQAQSGTRAVSELTAVKEELEVLRQTKGELADANEKIRKYKEKLTELSDVRDALEREQNAHGNAVDEIIRLEMEVNNLQPEKKKSEEYRIRALEAEVKLVECQDYLQRLEKKAKEENSALFNDIMMQKEQMDELRARIEQDVAASATQSDDANAIGEGISEMNPELMAELTRLRSENVHLRAFQAKRADDAVKNMEDSLSDCERLVEKYKSSYLETKSVLAATRDEFEGIQREKSQLQYQVQEQQTRCEEYRKQNGNLEAKIQDISTHLESTMQSLRESQEKCDNLNRRAEHLSETAQQRQSVVEQQSEELREYQDMIDKSQSDLQNLRNEVHKLKEICKEGSKANQKLQHDLESLSREHRETSCQLQQKETEVESLEQQTDELRNEIQQLDKDLLEQRQLRMQENEQARKNLEETCERLELQRKEELSLAEQSLKKTLEDQRNESRKKEAELDEKFQTCDKTWRGRFQELKEKSSQALHNAKNEHQENVKCLNREHDEAINKIKVDSKAKHNEVIQRGTKLMEEAKIKATAEICRLRNLHSDIEAKHRQVVQDKETMQAQFEAHCRKMQGELNAVHLEIEERSRELEESQEQLKLLEREKYKLSKENEQYKRKLGGQYGASGEIQAQLVQLRKEYNEVVEENRQLKKDMKSHSMSTITEDQSQDKPYRGRGGRIDSHMMTEIRQEYEKRIGKLNEEKRDVIMKLSSKESDIIKTQQKLWEREQEIDRLKKEKVDLQLQVERSELAAAESGRADAEQSMSQGRSPIYNSPSRIPRSSPNKVHRSSPSIDRAKRQKAAQEHLLRHRFQSMTGSKRAEPKIPTPQKQAVLPTPIDPHGDEEEAGSLSKAQAFRVKTTPSKTTTSRSSIVNATQMKSDFASSDNGSDPGECKQS